MRSKKAKIREIAPDTKFGSVKIAKLISRSMKDGKKSVAAKQVYAALDLASDKANLKPLELFEQVIKTLTPKMEVRSRRVGGAAYQVPTVIRGRRAFSLCIRWLILEAHKRPSKEFHSYSAKLAAEMLDVLQNQGGAIAKRDAAHRMADANKAFAHFKW